MTPAQHQGDASLGETVKLGWVSEGEGGGLLKGMGWEARVGKVSNRQPMR